MTHWYDRHKETTSTLAVHQEAIFFVVRVRVMVFKAISTVFHLYRESQFCCWRNLEKTTDLPQATDKLDHIMLYRVHLFMSGIFSSCLFIIRRIRVDKKYYFRWVRHLHWFVPFHFGYYAIIVFWWCKYVDLLTLGRVNIFFFSKVNKSTYLPHEKTVIVYYLTNMYIQHEEETKSSCDQFYNLSKQYSLWYYVSLTGNSY